jgi:hypothetical protein
MYFVSYAMPLVRNFALHPKVFVLKDAYRAGVLDPFVFYINN